MDAAKHVKNAHTRVRLSKRGAHKGRKTRSKFGSVAQLREENKVIPFRVATHEQNAKSALKLLKCPNVFYDTMIGFTDCMFHDKVVHLRLSGPNSVIYLGFVWIPQRGHARGNKFSNGIFEGRHSTIHDGTRISIRLYCNQCIEAAQDETDPRCKGFTVDDACWIRVTEGKHEVPDNEVHCGGQHCQGYCREFGWENLYSWGVHEQVCIDNVQALCTNKKISKLKSQVDNIFSQLRKLWPNKLYYRSLKNSRALTIGSKGQNDKVLRNKLNSLMSAAKKQPTIVTVAPPKGSNISAIFAHLKDINFKELDPATLKSTLLDIVQRIPMLRTTDTKLRASIRSYSAAAHRMHILALKRDLRKMFDPEIILTDENGNLCAMAYLCGDGQLKLLPGHVLQSGGQLYFLHGKHLGRNTILAAIIMMGVNKKSQKTGKWVKKVRKWKAPHYDVLFDALIMQCVLDATAKHGSEDPWFDHPRYINFRNHAKSSDRIRTDINLHLQASYKSQPRWTDQTVFSSVKTE